MIDQLRLTITGPVAVPREAASSATVHSPLRAGIAGGLLGAVSFGSLFPGLVAALAGPPVSAAQLAVYVVCGAWFGAINGGIIGAVIGGRGR